jgi:hypothetical protein
VLRPYKKASWDAKQWRGMQRPYKNGVGYSSKRLEAILTVYRRTTAVFQQRNPIRRPWTTKNHRGGSMYP